VLALFGVATPGYMEGRSVLHKDAADG
jgi:hypothetical protein